MKTWMLASVLVVASVGTALAQDPTFRKWCQPCHDAGPNAKVKLGPPLNGIDGRVAGTLAGFNFSDAMKNSKITWDEATFRDYVANPMKKIPGTRMAFAGVRDPKEIESLWNYLKAIGPDGNKK